MNNVRVYGQSPFRIAVVHGGPGAAGEMAPVAKELAKLRGVLEPLQTAGTVEEQIEELKAVLVVNAELPVLLIGYSWGAWLSILIAARHPFCVRKLILVSCGPLDEKYASKLQETRLSRLSEEEKAQYQRAIQLLSDPASINNNPALEQLGFLASKTDAYDPLPEGPYESISTASGEIFHNVWREAERLRKSGKLLEYARQVQCPVIAFHGDYDPHPGEEVRETLSKALKDFRFIPLPNCGHTPWLEKQARDEFYRILKEELD